MTLEEYNSIEEKEKFFINGGIKVNYNIEKIFEEIRKYYEEGDSYIFRGCSEAKYKMYSSAQRLYLNQELYKQVPKEEIPEHYRDFISNLIEVCKNWNNGVVKRLLIGSGIDENNALAYLSYMQHFGVPTPLLDFSFNPYVALFFAIDDLNYKPSNKEIDNYFSFYYTYTDATVYKGWRYVFDDKLKKEGLSYETIDQNEMSLILPNDELYKIMNSVNIINQEGLFFFNNDPLHPLEKKYDENICYLKEKLSKEKYDILMMHDTLSGCFNIHKSLIPAIKEKLNKLGINKNYVYPDMNDFKNSVTNNGILKSLTLNK